MASRFVGFTIITSLSGLGYYYYTDVTRKNVMVQDLMSRNELSKFLYNLHEQMAYTIDNVMDSFQSSYNQSHINNYKSSLLSYAEGNILQVCAGSNRNLKFYRPGSNLTLIDWSPNMVSMGITKVLPSIQFKYIVADVTKLPFPDNSFDTVVDIFGLEYTQKVDKALMQMRRVCKKNGTILLMNEGLSSTVEFHYWQNANWGKKLIEGGFFSNRNWQKIIQRFDFAIEHKERKKNGKLYFQILKNVKTPNFQLKNQQPVRINDNNK